MPKIVECVPNFSEGRHKEIIEAIANAIASSEGCSLLDVDPGVSTNRTVYTFIGTPETVVEGALAAARVAYQLIDMSRHSGEHPRMGALDVCPFIPVEGISMDECVQCAKEMGERLANELKVPVYLYGDASSEDHRKTLPQVRTGEYEGLPAKLCQPEWLPNYGPTEFVPSWGATAVGARKFLIAYNVNILGTKEQAHRIALNVREQRRSKNEQSGHLKKVQAIGWYLEEANMAQVSMNLLDFEVTPIHLAFEAVKKDAEELNLPIIGSQIIGMVPLKSLLNTAEYYMEKENLFILEEDQKLRLVVNKLGLHSLGQFNPKERIIDSGLRVSKDEIAAKYLPAIAGHLCESWDGYMVDEDKDGPLIRMSVKDFIMTVGCRSPSPGGGSVAALCASLGSALGSMVGFLTYGNRKFYELDSQIRRLIPSLYKAMKDLIPFVDADAAAFGEYMAALKMPQGTNEEKKQREDAMNQGLHTAIQVPLTVAKIANSVWPVMKELAQVGNINCKSDLQTGARVLETAVWGTYYNVLTNLKSIRDEDLKAEASGEIDKSLKMAQDNCTEVLTILDERQLREQ